MSSRFIVEGSITMSKKTKTSEKLLFDEYEEWASEVLGQYQDAVPFVEYVRGKPKFNLLPGSSIPVEVYIAFRVQEQAYFARYWLETLVKKGGNNRAKAYTANVRKMILLREVDLPRLLKRRTAKKGASITNSDKGNARRDKRILEMREYGETTGDIGKQFNISQGRVSQICALQKQEKQRRIASKKRKGDQKNSWRS